MCANSAVYITMTGMSLLLALLGGTHILSANGQLWFVSVMTMFAALFSYRMLFEERKTARRSFPAQGTLMSKSPE